MSLSFTPLRPLFAALPRLLLAAGFCFSAAVAASGSVGFESGPGSGAASYNQGKQIAAKKLLCTQCPLAGQKLNAALAQRISSEPALTQSLTAEEKSALSAYLSRRFTR